MSDAPLDKRNNLIWIDLEMTGLDTVNDYIIEIATIITDKDLNTVAEGPVLAIHQSEDVLGSLDEWNRNQHGNSGLLDRVRASTLTARDAERYMEAYRDAISTIGQRNTFFFRW